jgi:hypothetical protein
MRVIVDRRRRMRIFDQAVDDELAFGIFIEEQVRRGVGVLGGRPILGAGAELRIVEQHRQQHADAPPALGVVQLQREELVHRADKPGDRFHLR